MKIIELKAENIKKLKAIEIRPTENTVVISGKNGAGKSSILDSIWFALTGKDSFKNTLKPIREGEDHAVVTVDLGDLIVTRNWTSNENSYLKVENKDGSKHPSPQAMLDNLIGELSFDPLEFARLDTKAQKQTLLKLLNIEDKLQDLESNYTDIFNERTFIGREYKAVKAQLEGMDKPEEKLPEKEIGLQELSGEMEKAMEHNTKLNELDNTIERYKIFKEETQEEIKDLKKRLDEKENEFSELSEKLAAAVKVRNDKVFIDLSEVREKINQAQDTNKKIQAAKQYFVKKSEVEKLYAEGNAKTAQLNKIITKKQALVTSSKMPIDGLAVDENGVVYSGIPFSQLSSAEQLKVSLSIAMAANPKLKVLRILDGSLLDSTNMAIIKDMAKLEDYQVWCEVVDESGKVGIVIEDGEIIANNYKQEVLV